jgi:biotin-(acetyl-CoA carboxylase) ligase
VICGIGLNVNSGSDLLDNAGQSAVSLYSLVKKQFDVEFLIERLVKIVNRYYIICQQYPQDVFAKWREYNRLIGHEIEVVDPMGKSMRGVFRDVSPDGAMIFEADGEKKLFSCGDVKINAQSLDF